MKTKRKLAQISKNELVNSSHHLNQNVMTKRPNNELANSSYNLDADVVTKRRNLKENTS